MLAAALVSVAYAEAPVRDRAVTSVGGTAVFSHALLETRADIMAGERLDWGLSDSTRARFDGRFTFDPFDRHSVLEWMRLSEAEVRHTSGGLRLDVGRSVVAYGGPRLVDGLQVLGDVGGSWRVGGWGGLAPDLFTTLPRLRYGGGPVVAFDGDRANTSLAGEVLATSTGLDRLGALWLGRVEAGNALDLRGRLDVQNVGSSVGLADGAAFVDWQASDTLDVDAFYDAYSSLRYLESADLDPYVVRYLQRTVDLGLDPGISSDLLDPTVHQLTGASVLWEGKASGYGAPVLGLSGRARLANVPSDQFWRAGPRLGVHELFDGQVDVDADGAVTGVDSKLQEDMGLAVVYEPRESALSFDTSGRAFLGTGTAGTGWYGDLYVDWLAGQPWGLSLVAGVYGEALTDHGFMDQAEGGFLRVQVDPGRRSPPGHEAD